MNPTFLSCNPHNGPWKVAQFDDPGSFAYWFIYNPETGQRKKIGRIGGKRTNYFEKARIEADHRNQKLTGKFDWQVEGGWYAENFPGGMADFTAWQKMIQESIADRPETKIAAQAPTVTSVIAQADIRQFENKVELSDTMPDLEQLLRKAAVYVAQAAEKNEKGSAQARVLLAEIEKAVGGW